jgi:hypothetical protein
VDEQTRAPRIKSRRSRAEVQQLIAEYDASGLGRAAFCEQRGLSLSSLSRYRKRQQQKTAETADGKHWLAVEISGSAAVARGGRATGLAMVLAGGWRIEVGRGFDADTLKRLLAVVGRG